MPLPYQFVAVGGCNPIALCLLWPPGVKGFTSAGVFGSYSSAVAEYS